MWHVVTVGIRQGKFTSLEVLGEACFKPQVGLPTCGFMQFPNAQSQWHKWFKSHNAHFGIIGILFMSLHKLTTVSVDGDLVQ